METIELRKLSLIVESAEKKPVEAYGVKGMKSTSWRKTFKSQKDFEKWLEKNEGEVKVQGVRDLEESILKEFKAKGHECDKCGASLSDKDYTGYGSWSYKCPNCRFKYMHGSTDLSKIKIKKPKDRMDEAIKGSIIYIKTREERDALHDMLRNEGYRVLSGGVPPECYVTAPDLTREAALEAIKDIGSAGESRVTDYDENEDTTAYRALVMLMRSKGFRVLDEMELYPESRQSIKSNHPSFANKNLEIVDDNSASAYVGGVDSNWNVYNSQTEKLIRRIGSTKNLKAYLNSKTLIQDLLRN